MKPQKAPSDAIPRAVAARLSHYLRCLEELERQGVTTTSSRQLGKALGVTAAQVRKDLGYFGQFGFPGLGYKIVQLIPEIRRILGTDKLWRVGLVGVGSLGTALLRYKGFSNHGFRITAAFDSNPELAGTQVSGVSVHSITDLERVFASEGLELGIISVPAEAAQEVADLLVAAGAKGVFNFAPRRIVLPTSVPDVSVDLSVELERLSFLVSSLAAVMKEGGE